MNRFSKELKSIISVYLSKTDLKSLDIAKIKYVLKRLEMTYTPFETSVPGDSFNFTYDLRTIDLQGLMEINQRLAVIINAVESGVFDTIQIYNIVGVSDELLKMRNQLEILQQIKPRS